VPGVQVKVKRYKEIVVETMNLDSTITACKATGFAARAVQHEMDHLNGILIIDKASPIRKIFLRKKISKKISKIKEDM
jgi:peptide deformylase